MPSESSVKQNQSSSEDRNKHKQLDREIREMVSAITNRITDFHKSGSAHNFDDNSNDDEHGVRIITLAGTNDGATLKGELGEKTGEKSNFSSDDGESEKLSTFVNSNFQAINNSMMLGGSFHANDPGVHLDISDFSDPPHSQSYYHNKKQGKKAKKKEKLDPSKSTEKHHSDDDDSDSH